MHQLWKDTLETDGSLFCMCLGKGQERDKGKKVVEHLLQTNMNYANSLLFQHIDLRCSRVINKVYCSTD